MSSDLVVRDFRSIFLVLHFISFHFVKLFLFFQLICQVMDKKNKKAFSSKAFARVSVRPEGASNFFFLFKLLFSSCATPSFPFSSWFMTIADEQNKLLPRRQRSMPNLRKSPSSRFNKPSNSKSSTAGAAPAKPSLIVCDATKLVPGSL